MTQTASASPKPAVPDLFDPAKVTPEQAIAKVIAHAAKLGASDLFLLAGTGGATVQMRHLGIVHPLAALPGELGKKSVSYIKTKANMDIAERRRPLDGRWIYDLGEGQNIELRINTIPTLHGEDLAIRMILQRSQAALKLDDLGLLPQQLGQLRSMMRGAGGLVLVTGPTGSGKTATLYAALAELADGTRKMNTIEDPVEQALPGLRQSQVNPAIELGFGELLRAALRQSPDVIMLGEIRDPETAQTAVLAANSGILVFATLHAPDAASAVQTMRGLGAHHHFLAASMRGVIAQRLARTLCTKCRQDFDVSDNPHLFDDVRKWLKPGEGNKLYAGGGCEACGGTGYAGQIGVFELIAMNPTLRSMVALTRSARELRDKAVEMGMLSFRQAGLLKVAHGETTTEELFRVIPSESLLLDD